MVLSVSIFVTFHFKTECTCSSLKNVTFWKLLRLWSRNCAIHFLVKSKWKKNQLSKRRWLISHTILFEQRVNWYRCKSGSLKRRWLISHTILFVQRVNWYRCKSGSLKKQDFKMVFFYWTLKYSSTKKLNEKRSNNDRYNTLVLGSLLLLFFAYNIFCHVKFGMVEEKQKFENICPIIILQILKWLGSVLLR